MPITSALPYTPSPTTVWKFHIDGSTHPSFKTGAAGFVLYANDRVYYAQCRHLVGDYITSNYAEMQALVLCLKYCHEHCFLTPTIYTDSRGVNLWTLNKTNNKEGNMRLIRAAAIHYGNFLDYKCVWTPREDVYQRFTDFICNLGYLGNGSYSQSKLINNLINAYYTSPNYN